MQIGKGVERHVSSKSAGRSDERILRKRPARWHGLQRPARIGLGSLTVKSGSSGMDGRTDRILSPNDSELEETF